VSPRPYRLGRREASVEETREKVMAAAHRVFSEAGFHRASLDDVARRAGVARATVYYQFKSKFGLLEATIDHVLEHAPVAERMRKAREHPDAVTGLRLYIAEVCNLWAHDDVFFRNVIGLAAVDPEAARAVDQYDFRRRETLVWLAKRLQDQGKLRESVSQKQAIDTIWLLTSFRSYDQLVTRSGLSCRRASALLHALAEGILIPGARRKQGTGA
jgi:AcrR family transcriptional regulator